MIRADYVNYGACRLFSLWILQQDDEGCLFVKSHQLKIYLCIYIDIDIYLLFYFFQLEPGVNYRRNLVAEGKMAAKVPVHLFSSGRAGLA